MQVGVGVVQYLVYCVMRVASVLKDRVTGSLTQRARRSRSDSDTVLWFGYKESLKADSFDR